MLPPVTDGADHLEPWLWTAPGPLPLRLAAMGRVRMTLADTAVGDVSLVVVAPRGARRHDVLPLVVANDGPEYSRRAGLVSLLDALAAEGRVAPCRVALLVPDGRDARYAGNPDYATAVVDDVLPAVAAGHAVLGRPVLVGASLGALSALQSQWLRPDTFAGLLLQSGSFFRAGLDDEEQFEHWQRIIDFVSSVRRARKPRGDARMAMTCGADEGNLANNRLMAETLGRLGHVVDLTIVPGGHTWPQWRASLAEALPPLLVNALAPGSALAPGGHPSDR